MKRYRLRRFFYIIVFTSLWICQPQFAQDSITISGTILGPGGEPVENVAVTVDAPGTEAHYTGPDGSFSIRYPTSNVWLDVIPVGNLKPKSVYLNGKESIMIHLLTDNTESPYDLAGDIFGNSQKRELTHSVDVPEISGLQNFIYVSPDEYLQGQVPGMHITAHSGFPGNGSFGIIRGLRSMHTNAEPLILVDGIPLENEVLFTPGTDGFSFDPLTSVTPMDISHISVIKDGFLLTEYGARASNGIINIETLKPTENKTTIDVGMRYGIGFKPEPLPVLTSTHFRTLASEILGTSIIPEEDYRLLYPGLYGDPFGIDYYRYTNETEWQDEVFSNSSMYDMYLSIKGGDEIASYGLSVNNQNMGNIVRNTGMNRTNLRLVTDFRVFEWLTMSLSANLMTTYAEVKAFGPDPASNPILSALTKAPYMQPFEVDEDGNELPYYDDLDAFGGSNPSSIINVFEADRDNYRFLGKFGMNAHITDRLSATLITGYNRNSTRESLFYPEAGMEQYNDNENRNIVKQEDNSLSSLYGHGGLNFVSGLGHHGKLQARTGIRIQTNEYNEDIGITMDTPSDEYQSLSNGMKRYSWNRGDVGLWNWVTLYGTASASLQDRYFAGFSLSADASSRTGKDAESPINIMNTPVGIFPAINAAWRLSGERGLRDLSWLEDLKLRITYGLSGNDDIGNYTSRSTYEQVIYRERTGVIISSIPNTSLKFETITTLNAGMDLSMFNERVSATFDMFKILTNDLLIYKRREDYEGYKYSMTNGGTLENRGFEGSLRLRMVQTANFVADFGLNTAKYINEVIDIVGGEVITELVGCEIISRVGHPVNSFYGYKAQGVFVDQQEAQAANLINAKGIPFSAGDVKYADINSDGMIDENDKTILGSPNPDLYGGAYLYLGWKKWSLSTLFQYSSGNEAFNYVRYLGERMTDLSNQLVSTLNRWQYEGHVTDIPRAKYEDPLGNNEFSSRWIEDASYLRWKSLTIAYTIPEKFLIFRNAKFYISAHNIMVWTKYLGYDPEFSYASMPLIQGIDYGNTPQFTSLIIGLNMGL